jgi:hypothetical protein
MHDLSLHILDLIENSLRAKATTVSIHVDIDQALDRLLVRVEDNGEGIRVPPEEVLNPFYTTSRTKRVGLGLSFFKVAAEMAGGHLTLGKSRELGGVAVTATMELTHVDRPPLGDLAATISTMIFINPHVDFRLTIRSGKRAHQFLLSEFMKKKKLDGGANVQLGNLVLETLQAELAPWNRCERISWMERWQSGDNPFVYTKQSKLDQGADV